MDDHTVSVDEEISRPFMGRPHVVILGAGASVAAFPNGDRNGRRLPVMWNLVEMLGLGDTLDHHGVNHAGRNFEDVFSEIHADPKHETLTKLIEERVAVYFAQMMAPDEPNLYDHLVLSLRPKDVIATFNWDPFLYDACWRNYKRTDLPHVVYLHGNVRVGYCLKDMRKGRVGTPCSQCGELFSPSRLLFPVTHKDYNSDTAIRGEWENLRQALENAWVVTVFGYSAPTTDVEAIDLMQAAWGRWEDRELEEFEIIDIRPEDELAATWSSFIHSHHYRVENSLYDSLLAKHPRRSGEAVWNMVMEARFVTDREYPTEASFSELEEWYEPLLEAERSAANPTAA